MGRLAAPALLTIPAPLAPPQVRASASLSDEAVLGAIRRKLAGVPSVSYADIATTADAAGRRRLALLLLEHEPRVQVRWR